MKTRLLFFLVLFACVTPIWAQDFKILSLEYLPGDMTAREEMKTDDNGKQCAVVRITTKQITPEQRSLFSFECDLASYVVERRIVDGEILIWISPGTKMLKIKHPTLSRYDLYMSNFGITVEPLCTYKMVIQGEGNALGFVVTSQFLVFKVSPKDAMVTVNGTLWPVVDGEAQKMVDFGDYEYRIEATDYHPVTGKVKVNDLEKKVTVEKTLNPAFGYLRINGDYNLLSKASIYIDNSNGSEALRTDIQLKSGQHKVSIVQPKYKPYERTVTIEDGKTYTLDVNLNANFSTVTLKVDDDAEIWVNGEKKGTRTWTGELEAGSYTMECRKMYHKSSTVKETITDNMSGQTITLLAPTPIIGRLVVTSTPSSAKLYIDGKLEGESPMQLPAILIGEHTLHLEKDGCAPLDKTITIEENKTLTLNETLDTGRSIVVKTDRLGDKIYVDGDYVGETPRETPLGFGQHTIRVVRNGVKAEKDINIKESTRNGLELVFEFGSLSTISNNKADDEVLVDGESFGSYNGHVYVDLGLPSGTLWATCNVEAESPEDYGDYFAWGETTAKSSYAWSTYSYCNGDYYTLTKYSSNSDYGNIDHLTTLQTSDDAATANWGSGWCMPTKAQWEELQSNTTMTWTTQNGVNGMQFTASNGRILFLPAAGYRDGSSLNNAGSVGYYWSSSLYTDYPGSAWELYFNSDYYGTYHSNRYYGQSVRPVRSASQN